MSCRPKGSWVAIPTPFAEDDSIDFDVFAQLVDFQARHGTSALLVMGSAGEVTLLKDAERRRILETVVKLGRGKVPVFFGTSCSSTQDTLELTRYAEKCGADGVILTVPPYLNPPQEAVYNHFRKVIESIRIPVGVYNNPLRVRVNIEPETIARLAEEFEHFVVDKEAMPNNSQLLEVIGRTGGRLHVLCCDYPAYSIVMTNLGSGGHGIANITGNVIPAEMARMSGPWTSWDDVLATRELYFRYLPLMGAMYRVTNPVMVKAGLRLLGFKVGTCRMPLPDILPEKEEALKQTMTELGVIDKYRVR